MARVALVVRIAVGAADVDGDGDVAAAVSGHPVAERHLVVCGAVVPVVVAVAVIAVVARLSDGRRPECERGNRDECTEDRNDGSEST